ncbi:glycoside hydrolase family 28 protein [Phlebiopsis gigantea 11061_1 CR5-6]|uniref:Glycoside hydrolase family 28 protein n=1 Tax=Phlebiopsis gigantea (strain 11061_1 CR5-6) TaxID=745531 RepID=A0A0C3S246_PHLG1|nr:glycoside hydrolase family 28 protein [Phlebiopsis gigantea 11061_1 CR5-6]
MFLPVALLCVLNALSALAQLSGSVGPTTSRSSKQATICNVLSYGGTVGSSDIGPAIQSAFTNCVLKNKGSTLYIPPGNYDMATWVTLKGATQWALQLDGVITRTATTGGHMFVVTNANDFEMWSSTSAGAIQGNGYQCRNAGPRLLRIITSKNFSLHDLIFVDSPEFHVIIDNSSNGELYNLAIRGADIGGSDGIDLSGSNVWVHDVEVTNRDECVTIKNPSSNHQIERIWCNQSGGSAIGSLGSGTAIENIYYKNIYTNGGSQMFMIKSNGGDGYVKNVVFDHFMGLGTAYGLDIDEFWSDAATAPGDGVVLSNITFSNWNGYITDGHRRSAYRLLCSDSAPCTGITIGDVYIWAENNVGTYACESAYGHGACLKSGTGSGYAATTTSYTQPAAYVSPTALSGNLASGFATNSPIPIPTIPTTFYPGLPQISPLAKNGG